MLDKRTPKDVCREARDQALHWRKTKVGLGGKKSASEASQEAVWGGEMVDLSTFPGPSLGSLCSPIFFLFDPVFCLFLFPQCGAWSQVG